MAEIEHNQHHGSRKGKRRAKKQSTRMDMTPMVDLAFLLLTFFVLTATFARPKSMELSFPAPTGDPAPVKNGITFLLSKNNRIFYYEGEFRSTDNAMGKKTELHELSFVSNAKKANLHDYLLQKNKPLHMEIKKLCRQHENRQISDSVFKSLVKQCKEDKQSFTYLVKTDNHATYKNVVDVVDELNVNVVGKYVVADIMKPELDLLGEKIQQEP